MMIALILATLLAPDTVLNRSVTVERDYQPVIESAGKIKTEPVVLETEIETAPIEYSDYTMMMAPSFNTTTLLSQPTHFTARKPKNGYITGGLGHPLTLFAFGYHVDDGKKSILDLYAHHNGLWGSRAVVKTDLGFDFKHPFSTSELYFGLKGGNLMYRMPGKDDSKQISWDFLFNMGVRANKKQDFQYDVNIGYYLVHLPAIVTEHQLRTRVRLEWAGSDHHVGANIYLQNNFILPADTAWAKFQNTYRIGTGREVQTHNHRHALQIEPFYAYYGNRFTIHAGAHFDMVFGKGNLMSGSDDIAFAPSPNIRFEAQIAKQWLTLYGDITGKFSTASEQAWLNECLYYNGLITVGSKHVGGYTPLDGTIGFHIKPQKWLLLEIHGGYALQLNQSTIYASKPLEGDKTVGWLDHIYTDYQRVKVGLAASFHYQDIINIHVWGDYYGWKRLHVLDKNETGIYDCTLDTGIVVSKERIYDRPEWEIGLRVDGKIDSHWSVYLDSHFAGSRWALAYDGDHRLKPKIDLNLGAEYNWWEKDLTFFAQLNNIIHRHNDLYYAYDSVGINGLIGVTWRF